MFDALNSLLELIKAVYGLKDAPMLWLRVLLNFLWSLGMVSSYSDTQLLYMRCDEKGRWSTGARPLKTGKLIGACTAHVDDLGVGGIAKWRCWLHSKIVERFGDIRQESKLLLHVGAQYEQFADHSMTIDLCEYIDLIEPAKVPKDQKTLLDIHGQGELMRVNGSMIYGSKFRPDAKGPVAVSAAGTAGEPTGESLATANKALKLLQEDNENCRLWFPPLKSDQLKLCVITDSSWKNIRQTYSQNAYTVLSCERWEDGDVGGVGHDLEDKSGAATRVAKSSMGAETLGATAGAEAGHRVMKTLDEAWNGAESAAELRDRPYPIPLQLVGDAKDIFDTLKCEKAYTGADGSMAFYIAALREDLRHGRVNELVWVETGSMLCDAMTKMMRDTLFRLYYATGCWTPGEYLIWVPTTKDAALEFMVMLCETIREKTPLWDFFAIHNISSCANCNENATHDVEDDLESSGPSTVAHSGERYPKPATQTGS